VVGIIAILAAIAVPNFLEAQVRSKVSRAASDMRSLATAIESYMVDNNNFPVATSNSVGDTTPSATFTVPTGDSNNNSLGTYVNVNYGLASTKGKLGNGAGTRCSFAIQASDAAGTGVGTRGLMTLTTPVAYITSYPVDPFADTRGLSFGYTNAANSGWVLWSFGPDCDENLGGQLGQGIGYDTNVTATGVAVAQTTALDRPFGVTAAPTTTSSWGSNYTYNPYSSNPNSTLLSAGFTYDTTNGSTSGGDIYRVKQ
jgi:type II secretory pathway pseudopilin PulG